MFSIINILRKIFYSFSHFKYRTFNDMLLIFILNIINTCVGFVTLSDYIAEESNFSNNNNSNNNQNCICVPYWQCKDDFSGLIDDGVDLMDIRIYNSNGNEYGCTGDFDICCQVECGKSKAANSDYYENYDDIYDTLATRILGVNNEASYAEFPWMLGILYGRAYKCGATLIHPQVAMTAAHCVNEGVKYKVRAGEWNWLTKEEPLVHQDRFTKKIIIHPDYQATSLRNDIALLILERPFKLAENVGIVCLPTKLGTNNDGRRCIASGWGKNSIKKDSYQSVLKKIDLPILKNDYCVTVLRKIRLGYYFNLHKSFLCAGGEHNKDTCKGDGGSPLMCPLSDSSDRYEQIGIVSWGLTCGVQNTPGVYVNVAMFSDWIDNEMMLHNFDIKIYRM